MELQETLFARHPRARMTVDKKVVPRKQSALQNVVIVRTLYPA